MRKSSSVDAFSVDPWEPTDLEFADPVLADAPPRRARSHGGASGASGAAGVGGPGDAASGRRSAVDAGDGPATRLGGGDVGPGVPPPRRRHSFADTALFSQTGALTSLVRSSVFVHDSRGSDGSGGSDHDGGSSYEGDPAALSLPTRTSDLSAAGPSSYDGDVDSGFSLDAAPRAGGSASSARRAGATGGELASEPPPGLPPRDPKYGSLSSLGSAGGDTSWYRVSRGTQSPEGLSSGDVGLDLDASSERHGTPGGRVSAGGAADAADRNSSRTSRVGSLDGEFDVVSAGAASDGGDARAAPPIVGLGSAAAATGAARDARGAGSPMRSPTSRRRDHDTPSPFVERSEVPGAGASNVFQRFEDRLAKEVHDILERAARPGTAGPKRTRLLQGLFTNLCRPIEDEVKSTTMACGCGALLPGGSDPSDMGMSAHYYFELVSDYYGARGGAAAQENVLSQQGYWTSLWSDELFPAIFSLLFGAWLLGSPLDPRAAAAAGRARGDSTSGSVGGGGGDGGGGSGGADSPADMSDSAGGRVELSLSVPEWVVFDGPVDFDPDMGNRFVVFTAGASRCFWYDIQHDTDVFAPLYKLVKRVVLHPAQLSNVTSPIRHQMHQLVCRVFLYYDCVIREGAGDDYDERGAVGSGGGLERQQRSSRRAIKRSLSMSSVASTASRGTMSPSVKGSRWHFLPGDEWDAVQGDVLSLLQALPLLDHEEADELLLDRRIDNFIVDLSQLMRNVKCEASLVGYLRGLRAFRGMRLDPSTANKLQGMLYAFSSAGGPIFPTRPVRHTARTTMDIMFPAGRRTRSMVRLAFRLLHPYYWPSSVAYYARTITSDVVNRCTSGCRRTVCAALCRCGLVRSGRGARGSGHSSHLRGGAQRRAPDSDQDTEDEAGSGDGDGAAVGSGTAAVARGAATSMPRGGRAARAIDAVLTEAVTVFSDCCRRVPLVGSLVARSGLERWLWGWTSAGVARYDGDGGGDIASGDGVALLHEHRE